MLCISEINRRLTAKQGDSMIHPLSCQEHLDVVWEEEQSNEPIVILSRV